MTTEYFFMPDVKIQVSSIKAVRMLEESTTVLLETVIHRARVCIDVTGGVVRVYTGEDAALSILALQDCGFLTKPQAAAMQKRFYRLNRGAKKCLS